MADGQIELNVDFTAAPGTQTTALVERGLSATGPWSALMTLTLVGQVGVGLDTTAPFDTPVWYRFTGQPGDEIIIQGPFTTASTGAVWLRDPLRPWADIQFDFCETAQGGHVEGCTTPEPEFVWSGFDEFERFADAGLFHRFDSETPADVWGRRKNMAGGIRFLTRTLAAKQHVYELFTAGGPLLLQMPAIYGWADAFIQPGTLTEAYITQDQRKPYRAWSAPFEIVDTPTGVPQGTECANWCAVAEAYPTFADMTGAGGTWADVASGELVCPSALDGFGIGPFGDGPFGDGG